MTGGTRYAIGSVAGFLFLVAALIGLLVRHALVGAGPVGWLLQGGAVALNIWARITFGRRSFHASADPTEGGLVTTGPYRWIRHPIYASILLFLFTGVASHPSPVSGGLAALAAVGAALRIVAEERLVRKRYPEYGTYAARTRCLVPFVF
jgi:protein-S-isoprenylcysteine O-methyltransferase Ste14